MTEGETLAGMMRLNQRAAEIVHTMTVESEILGLRAVRLNNGATVIDAGIHVPGSLEAGRLFACACLGGLGQVAICHQSYALTGSDGSAGFWLPTVTVSVTLPAFACMASQYAGWALRLENFAAIGSGPARAMAAQEDIFRTLGYREDAPCAILMLEGRTLPDEEVAAHVAKQCGLRAEQVALVIAPTASLVGSVQIAARSVETGMHKMAELGFDVRRVQAATGSCPLAPVASDDTRAIGRTNDAILYGSEVFFAMQADDAELGALAEKIPSCNARDYGIPFYELFLRHGGDFFAIDRMLFSPARVILNSLHSGKAWSAGALHPVLLHASLLGS